MDWTRFRIEHEHVKSHVRPVAYPAVDGLVGSQVAAYNVFAEGRSNGVDPCHVTPEVLEMAVGIANV